jgi:hypothetical protein
LTVVDDSAKAIAKRIVTNAEWASIYFGYFESSNKFLRGNHHQLDDDAHELLIVLEKGLPRLTATCLCRLWDEPGKDRHSLPALNRNVTFSQLAMDRDRSFVGDCNRMKGSREFQRLKNFRDSDLAHNLTIAPSGSGFTIDELRGVVTQTQSIIDRLTIILSIQGAPQKDIFDIKRLNCDDFWNLVTPIVVKQSSFT